MMGLKRGIASEFVPEWCVIAVLAVVNILWARQIGMRLIVTPQDFALLYITLGAMVGLKFLALKRGGLMAEYFSLTLAAATATCVLSYLCLASSGTVIDTRLMAMDHALGFDWISGYRWVSAHPLLKSVLGFAYGSLFYQGLYFGVLLVLMHKRDELREMFWLVLLSGLMACAGSYFLPAFGPSKLYDIGTHNGFMPTMIQLVDGHNLTFAVSKMTGVVSFPSFHTAMALSYAWAFRRMGAIGWAFAAFNLVVLASVPWFGGHYLVDMIGGAVTMLIALGLVQLAPQLWKTRTVRTFAEATA